jgi:hypothetical protein
MVRIQINPLWDGQRRTHHGLVTILLFCLAEVIVKIPLEHRLYFFTFYCLEHPFRDSSRLELLGEELVVVVVNALCVFGSELVDGSMTCRIINGMMGAAGHSLFVR